MGNEPILALPEGADNFVVYYDAQSKDLEACLEKGEGDCLYVATTEGDYHSSKDGAHLKQDMERNSVTVFKWAVTESMMALVKVRWDSKRGPELTWERKDQMRSKCPQLFVDSANASSS
ncbi:hypothetical protein Tco_1261055 [Tanacetum coccineum]